MKTYEAARLFIRTTPYILSKSLKDLPLAFAQHLLSVAFAIQYPFVACLLNGRRKEIILTKCSYQDSLNILNQLIELGYSILSYKRDIFSLEDILLDYYSSQEIHLEE